LQEFVYLLALAPKMTVAEFGARVASAFFLWPKELLEAELNRNALASTIQHDFFDGNPDGWRAYVAHIQKKVKWFGTGLPEMKSGTTKEPAQAVGACKTDGSVGRGRALCGVGCPRREEGLALAKAGVSLLTRPCSGYLTLIKMCWYCRVRLQLSSIQSKDLSP
jgi:hypothetical protein